MVLREGVAQLYSRLQLLTGSWQLTQALFEVFGGFVAGLLSRLPGCLVAFAGVIACLFACLVALLSST